MLKFTTSLSLHLRLTSGYTSPWVTLYLGRLKKHERHPQLRIQVVVWDLVLFEEGKQQAVRQWEEIVAVSIELVDPTNVEMLSKECKRRNAIASCLRHLFVPWLEHRFRA